MKQEMHIFTDQAGYLPNMIKRATITTETDSFQIIDNDGKVCMTGKTEFIGYDEKSGEDLRIADFSQLTEKGTYNIILPNGECSDSFVIGEEVYRKCFNDATKAFYYLRCGCILDKKHAGKFTHGCCHTRKALVWEDGSEAPDVTGGWHDAGDYGRYVTAGACALSHLLYAYRFYPNAFTNQDLNIPESGSAEPDILCECRVELDWLMKMQRSDGAVYHKLTTKGHAPFVMPEDDTAQLYLLPPSSMAAADTAAVLALASGIYSEFDKEYSDKLLEKALLSYSWLEKNPEFLYINPPECTTGSYGERDDTGNRFWAAAELFALTGEEKYHDVIRNYSRRDSFPVSLGYSGMDGIGMLSYILSDKAEEYIRNVFIRQLVDRADCARNEAASDGFGCSLKEYEFGWGSNMGVLKNAMLMLMAQKLTGDSSYEAHVAEQLHYILGRDPLGISYISGTGVRSINEPHLRPTYADGIDECIPGMVSGGPNKYLSDPDAKLLIPEGTPAMKCFVDDYRCYSLNEITIYWNSPAVFVLAYFNN